MAFFSSDRQVPPARATSSRRASSQTISESRRTPSRSKITASTVSRGGTTPLRSGRPRHHGLFEPPPVFRGVARLEQSPVHHAAGRRQLGHHRGGVTLVRFVEHPGQELRPLAKRSPTSLGEEERSPLTSGHVALEEGEDGVLFVIQML